MEHVLVTDGDIQGLKQPIFLIFPTTVVIQGADSLLCRLSWHCPCPLPFGCHSHHNTELPAKRCLMSSWRWDKVRRTRSEEMEGLVLGKE